MLSTAGCPVQSGLSSEGHLQRKVQLPQSLWRQPRGAYGLHYVQTGDLSGRGGYAALGNLSPLKCNSATEAFYLYFNELFVSESALDLVVLSVYLLHSLYKARSDVFAAFVALH